MSERGRILVVTSSFPRWARDATSPFVLHLAQDLQALGWRIDVLAPHTAGAANRESINGVCVERFRYFWPASAQTLCYGGGALVNLRRNRRNALKVPVFAFFQCLAIASRLLCRKYDLVHSHWLLPQALSAALSSVPLRIPHVVTIHGGDVFSLRGRLMGRLKRIALGSVNAVTVNSRATCAAVTQIAPGLQELHRIPPGAAVPGSPQPTLAEFRSRLRRGPGPLLVFVGRVIEEKGVGDLLRAVALLVPRLPTVTAVIVGDGQGRSDMERLASELAVGDRIVFAGAVAPDDVSHYLAAADIFVGPSKRASDGWLEGLGLTFIEAMLARTPVVATRVGGIPDVVHHEQTGLLVSENAPDEIADAVERLVTDAELAAKLRESAFESARRNFTREAAAQAFSQLFERLILAKI